MYQLEAVSLFQGQNSQAFRASGALSMHVGSCLTLEKVGLAWDQHSLCWKFIS